MSETMTGAEMVVRALHDQGVDTIFGYPGGAVLPIYDAMFQQDHVKHVLVRHEQGAVHAAEGYARSSGKVGVVLVTSGPGATNAVTGLTGGGACSVSEQNLHCGHASPMRSRRALAQRSRPGSRRDESRAAAAPCSPRTVEGGDGVEASAVEHAQAAARDGVAPTAPRISLADIGRRYPRPVRARRRDGVAVRANEPREPEVRRPSHGDAALRAAQPRRARAARRRASTSVSGPGQCRAARRAA